MLILFFWMFFFFLGMCATEKARAGGFYSPCLSSGSISSKGASSMSLVSGSK